MKILILFALLFSNSLMAAQNISCWDGSCLKFGWTRQDLSSGSYSDFQCYRSGCSESGWVVGGSQNINYYTQCKEKGCFVSGWYELSRQTQELQKQISCIENDCLKRGWTTSSKNGFFITECAKNDCQANGWSTTNPAGQNEIVTCKKGGCFTEGWIESSL
jgi:hypothetical protein